MSSENQVTVYKDPALEKVLAMWKDPKQLPTIRKCYAPKLNDTEFEIFVGMGISLGLNPFLREIWAVKYDEKAGAQIFIGRDGYRKIISRNENYDGHICAAVYSNDEFHTDLVKVEIRHVPNLKDRGKLMGAYCLVYMKNVSKPYYVWVDFDEYNLKRSVWNDKPATMIKKVAECQGIRMADQSCSGTYGEEEGTERMLTDYEDSNATKLRNRINQGRTIEGESEDVIDPETGEVNEAHAPPPKDPNAPQYTFEELRDKLANATNLDTLTEAASLISSMGFDDEKRGELKIKYTEKMREFKGLK